MEGVENYIENKTEEIISSPSFQNIEEEKKKSLRKKINTHLNRMVIETFVNRLDERDARRLTNLIKNSPEKAKKELDKLAASTPDLAKDLEQRIDKEAEKFKSLGV